MHWIQVGALDSGWCHKIQVEGNLTVGFFVHGPMVPIRDAVSQ